MSDQEAARVCENCGASNASEAQFCGVCGHELPGGAISVVDAVFQGSPDANPWQASQASAWSGLPAALESGDSASSGNLGEMAAAAQAPIEGADQKRCSWCGGLNPWVAAVCEACGARFPVPEQDAAFRRAAEERLRQEEADLEAWRQQRRRSWRRFFSL
jgi:ribosomal protein L40E